MNMQTLIPEIIAGDDESVATSSDRCFISGNTLPMTLEEIRFKHLIPVFVRDNEPLISIPELIDNTHFLISKFLPGETILKPILRVSHPIKGRIPEAKHKAANELRDDEKTIYYERAMFVIEIPSITIDVGNNRLSLIIGGVKAYNQDNLYNRLGALQHFKLFIGFQNLVCTNLCLSTDGVSNNLAVRSVEELSKSTQKLISNFDARAFSDSLRVLTEYTITEYQFAELIGKLKMFQYLPPVEQADLNGLKLNDNQLTNMLKDYYNCSNFGKSTNESLNLWQLYNLFTGVNKTSYIDSFINRASAITEFIAKVKRILDGQPSWFIESSNHV